jgi:hypothetical protein
VIVEARPTGTPPIAPQEIGRDPAFIDEHVLPHVAKREPRAPVPAGRRDVRPMLFVGVYGFF